MSTPEPRFSCRTSIHGGNSRNCAKCIIHNRCSAKALYAAGPSQPQLARPSGGGEQRRGRPQAGRCRAPRSVRLPRAQVQLSLMALYLLPDASFCSFFRISSILTFAGARPETAGEAREARPGMSPPLCLALRELGGRCARQHPAGARLLMNHARSMPRATSVLSPRPVRPAPRPPAGVRCAPAMGRAEGGELYRAALTRRSGQALAGSRLRGKLEADVLSWLAGQALVELSPKERLIGCGQPAGRGLTAVLPTPPPAPGWRSWGVLGRPRFVDPPPQLHLLIHFSVCSLFSEQFLWATLRARFGARFGARLGRYL